MSRLSSDFVLLSNGSLSTAVETSHCYVERSRNTLSSCIAKQSHALLCSMVSMAESKGLVRFFDTVCLYE